MNLQIHVIQSCSSILHVEYLYTDFISYTLLLLFSYHHLSSLHFYYGLSRMHNFHVICTVRFKYIVHTCTSKKQIINYERAGFTFPVLFYNIHAVCYVLFVVGGDTGVTRPIQSLVNSYSLNIYTK